jgi:glycosyltransferase involved in cell wall biosynthesis
MRFALWAIGFAGMRRLALHPAGPTHGLFLHHRDGGTVHFYIQDRDRFTEGNGQLQMQGSLVLCLFALEDILPDGLCGPRHGLVVTCKPRLSFVGDHAEGLGARVGLEVPDAMLKPGKRRSVPPPGLMQGESIIFFNKEYGQETTSADHVFEELAKTNKALWVNSIATRNPNLASGADWRRIFQKVRKLFGGLRQIGPTAWLYQPFFIPLPYSATATRINRWLLRAALRRQMRRLGFTRPQLWTSLPTAAYMIGQLDESVVVYYCVDNWSEFAHLDGARLLPLERELLAKADVVFATSAALEEMLKKQNPNTWLSRHGVDFEKFGAALAPETAVPADLSGLPHPVIGFFGVIRKHIDVPLLVAMARRHPEWSLALIGSVQMDLGELAAFPNVHLLGKRDYHSLPAYCKGFDVGIIPYLRTEFTRHVNPIKLRQYLSAGLPVVTTAIPEVLDFGHLAAIATTTEEFIAAVERELGEDSPAKKTARREAMRSETWEARVARVCERVMEAQSRRRR